MSLRDPFTKCLAPVVALIPKMLEGAMLLERLPHFGYEGAQFLYQGKVYWLGFPQTGDLLAMRAAEYEHRGQQLLSNSDPIYQQFRTAYQRALWQVLKRVVQAGNTDYLCEPYASYLLAHYQQVMDAAAV